jgi:hypothetical protein
MEWEDVSYLYFPFLFYVCFINSFLDGFFDAGMLLHALKGLSADREAREKPVKRRFVGKKLHLNEY